MDQGGLFAGDVNTIPGLIHHSSLAAGQREENEEGGEQPLRVAAAGELRVERRGDPDEVYEVRSISDASGHFQPETGQTMQFVKTLQDAGVDLDNTSINLVAKPVYDTEGNLRGTAPAIKVYSGEFIAAEGDQIALTDKRAVMDQISGREWAPHREGADDVLYSLDERRAALNAEAESPLTELAGD